MMNARDLMRISADAHVDEPHDLWFERLSPGLREKAPRRIHANADGGWSLVVDGSAIGWTDVTAEEADLKESERLAAVSPDARLQMMRTDDLNAEMVYPTIGLYVWNIADSEVGRACCTVYNDWILERLGGNPRIKLAGMIPTWSPEMAVAEVHRLEDEQSIGAMLLPLVSSPSWNMPEWEPLWEAIADTGKPAVMHQGSGHEMLFYRGWGSATANLLATQSMAPRAAGLLACGGVLERHPALHVVLVEVNAGWIAWACSTLDEYYLAHRHWSKPVLKKLPSHYVLNQMHATFQDDRVGIHNIELTGSSCLMWGNDYPHPESTYPNSGEVIERLFHGVDLQAAQAVLSRNAMKVFGFDQSVLAERP